MPLDRATGALRIQKLFLKMFKTSACSSISNIPKCLEKLLINTRSVCNVTDFIYNYVIDKKKDLTYSN